MKSCDLSSQLYEQIFVQCLAMAKHAFSSGLQVDGAIVQFLEDFGERKSCSQLGGFSSTAVYRILNSLVGAVESLVRGGTEDLVKSKVREREYPFYSESE
jgi:hypothetical protein